MEIEVMKSNRSSTAASNGKRYKPGRATRFAIVATSHAGTSEAIDSAHSFPAIPHNNGINPRSKSTTPGDVMNTNTAKKKAATSAQPKRGRATKRTATPTNNARTIDKNKLKIHEVTPTSAPKNGIVVRPVTAEKQKMFEEPAYDASGVQRGVTETSWLTVKHALGMNLDVWADNASRDGITTGVYNIFKEAYGEHDAPKGWCVIGSAIFCMIHYPTSAIDRVECGAFKDLGLSVPLVWEVDRIFNKWMSQRPTPFNALVEGLYSPCPSYCVVVQLVLTLAWSVYYDLGPMGQDALIKLHDQHS